MNSMKTTIFLFLLGMMTNTAFCQEFNLNSSQFKVGDVYTANPNILFVFGDADIIKESYEQLNQIATFLIKHDSIVVEVGVHVDSRLPDETSISLDQMRADKIVNYLVSKGVNQDRLIAVGYGKTQLIISNEEIMKSSDPESLHAINRRIEFKVVGIR